MGHEFTGTVVEKGDDVKTLAVGDVIVSPFTTSWYVYLKLVGPIWAMYIDYQMKRYVLLLQAGLLFPLCEFFAVWLPCSGWWPG